MLLQILLACAAFVFARIVYNLHFHPLRRFPGPRLWAASRLPYVLSLIRGDLVQRTQAIHERWGPMVRLAPNELSFIQPQAWQDIYGFHPGKPNFPKNPLWMQPGENGIHSILSANDADHSRYRRLLAHAFSERALRQQEELLLSYVELLTARLRELAAGPGQAAVVNLVEWFNFATFDIVGDLSLGESFHCLDESRYHGWVAILFAQFHLASVFVGLRFFGLDRLVRQLIPKSVVRKRMEHAAIANEKIHRRLEQGASTGGRSDFMAYILRHNDEKGMSVAEIEATLRTLVVVGSETTGTALAGVVRNLLRHPDVMAKATAEVRRAFSHASEIDAQRTSELAYLSAVIEESLRLCPPVPLGMPRVVPAGGAEVVGEWLPGNVFVSASGYTSNRSVANFPDHPVTFKPERWLQSGPSSSESHSTPTNSQPSSPSGYNPFSLGPRNCLGRNLAWLEMRLILAHLLWDFDLSIPEGQTIEPWENQRSWILWEKAPLRVRIEPRT